MYILIALLSSFFYFATAGAQNASGSGNSGGAGAESAEENPFVQEQTSKGGSTQVSAQKTETNIKKDEPVEQAPSEYTLKIKEGVSQVLSRNFDDAIGTFQQAIEVDSERLEAYNHLASAFLLAEKNKDAIETFKLLHRKAKEEGHVLYQARAMHGVANYFGQTEPRSKSAKDAWRELIEFAEKHPEIYKKEWAQQRLTKIEDFEKLDKEYEQVRKRIAERKKSVEKDLKNKNKKKRRKKR